MNSLLTMDFREDVYDHTADIYLRETFSLQLDPVILQYYCEESLGQRAIERKECKSILSKY